MDKTSNNTGAFIISIDFELLWGVWDAAPKEKYGDHIVGVKNVIPRLLTLFERYDFKTTFATVGFLFAKDKAELQLYLPEQKPSYSDSHYDVYSKELSRIGDNENDDPYHFGYSLFEQIKNSPHEIGTHTFCHYYCLEDGQSAEEFDADIKAAKKIAEAKGVHINSIVFPRNQFNPDYLAVLAKNGINVYRGNPGSWIYKPRKFTADILFIRLCRLLDSYLPISGYNNHIPKENGSIPVNIPASRFLKPYNKRLAWFEKLKLRRIMKEMTVAAQQGAMYHLWWHPHNFGCNIEENINNLTVLLDHYNSLKKEYGFENLTMSGAADF